MRGKRSTHASKKEYKERKEEARALVHERLEYWNSYYRFAYNKVFIKNSRTRWGSCSKKGNVNFNYRIVHLPKDLADYLIVHELCHLKEFNHSEKFWKLVALTIPDFEKKRRVLRTFPMKT